jgi:hypothetical protein
VNEEEVWSRLPFVPLFSSLLPSKNQEQTASFGNEKPRKA